VTPSHTRKKSRRYRYYVNQALIQFKQIPDSAVTRLPAQALESLVEKDLIDILTNTGKLISALAPLNLSATEQKQATEQAQTLAKAWQEIDIYQPIELCNRLIEKSY